MADMKLPKRFEKKKRWLTWEETWKKKVYPDNNSHGIVIENNIALNYYLNEVIFPPAVFQNRKQVVGKWAGWRNLEQVHSINIATTAALM